MALLPASMMRSSSASRSDVSAPRPLSRSFVSATSPLNLLTAILRPTESMIHCPTLAARDRTRVAATMMKTDASSLFSGETTTSPKPEVVDVQSTK